MNTIKLLALIYSPEDQNKMYEWQATANGACEIVQWSQTLDLPIQTAVAHFCEHSEYVDGLLIDDHTAYDEIAMKRVEEYIKLAGLNLYSAASDAEPIYAYSATTNNSNSGSGKVFAFVHETEPATALKPASKSIKVAV